MKDLSQKVGTWWKRVYYLVKAKVNTQARAQTSFSLAGRSRSAERIYISILIAFFESLIVAYWL